MIPYNPSSFNTNKTILEQILEIKKWLIAHPSYKVYYCTSNFMPTGDDDRAFSEIAGTEEEVQNIAVGDLLVFPDAYYSEVIAVDLDNEMVTVALPATNFSGPQGATGPSGADGTNGTCIRYCNTNKNSNPSTTYAVSDITFSTGLQINDCILFKNNRIGFVDYISGGTFRVTQNIIIDGKDGQYVDTATINSDGDLIITLYDPESMIQSNINAGHVVGADGNDGVSVTNVTIDGNQHLIVTLSNGNTIDAGSVSSGGTFDHYVIVTNTSGTLSDSDYNNLTYNDSVLIYDNSEDYLIYVKEEDKPNEMSFIKVTANGLSKFKVTKSTKAYTRNTTKLQGAYLGSAGASNGQVLQADGNGGASWQNASGSGVEVVNITTTSGTFSASDIAKLSGDNCIIVRTISTNIVVFRKANQSSSRIYYRNDTAFTGNSILIEIVIATGVWTTSTYTLEGTSITSTGVTSGKVLQADGNGGASWQTPSGSGLNKYTFTPSTAYQLCQVLLNAKSSKVMLTNLNINFTFVLNGTTLYFNGTRCDGSNGYIYHFEITNATSSNPAIATGDYWTMTTAGNSHGAISSVTTLSNWSVEYLNETQLH